MTHRLRTTALEPLIDHSVSFAGLAVPTGYTAGDSTSSHRNRWGKVIDRALQRWELMLFLRADVNHLQKRSFLLQSLLLLHPNAGLYLSQPRGFSTTGH